MQIMDLTLETPEENLALDEVLLDAAEVKEGSEVLRFWESSTPFVVLGQSNKVEEQVHMGACESRGIPILRRVSGGGTVMQGPGCLNYTLILEIKTRPYLATIKSTNCEIMKRQAEALVTLDPNIRYEGITDLAHRELKFSGNAQRRKRKFCLFHGTILYNFDLELVSQCLKHPMDQPEYRKDREHKSFIANINLPPEKIKNALTQTWQAFTPLATYSHETLTNLIITKYSQKTWNQKF